MPKKSDTTAEVRFVREYFLHQTELVNVPPVPVLVKTSGGREALRAGLRRAVFAGAIAGAASLLMVTAGRDTYLSEAIDSVTVGYVTDKKLTGFLMEAAQSFRNEITGGTRK